MVSRGARGLLDVLAALSAATALTNPDWRWVAVAAAVVLVVVAHWPEKPRWNETKELDGFREDIVAFYRVLDTQSTRWDDLAPFLRWHTFPYNRPVSTWSDLVTFTDREWDAIQVARSIYRKDSTGKLGGSGILGQDFDSFHDARFKLKQRLDRWGNRKDGKARKLFERRVIPSYWSFLSWLPYLEIALAEHIVPQQPAPGLTGLWRLVGESRIPNNSLLVVRNTAPESEGTPSK